jgi:hypothetical protein
MKKRIELICTLIALVMTACTLDGANLIGPAGGAVFYDKGGYSDGWRYLEAAPDDAGSGDWDRAVQICEDYSHGGYNAWRLPDVYELEKLLDSGDNDHLPRRSDNIDQETVVWSSEEDEDDPSKAWGIAFVKKTSVNDKGETVTNYNKQPPAVHSKEIRGIAWPVLPF